MRFIVIRLFLTIDISINVWYNKVKLHGLVW